MGWNLYFERALKPAAAVIAGRASLGLDPIGVGRSWAFSLPNVVSPRALAARQVKQSANDQFVAALQARLDAREAPLRQGEAAPAAAVRSETREAPVAQELSRRSFMGPLIAADERYRAAALQAADAEPRPPEQALVARLGDPALPQITGGPNAPGGLAGGNEEYGGELDGKAAEADPGRGVSSSDVAPPAAPLPVARPERAGAEAEASQTGPAKLEPPRVRRAKAEPPRVRRAARRERAGGGGEERRYARGYVELRRTKALSAQMIEELSARSGARPALPSSLLPTLPGSGP